MVRDLSFPSGECIEMASYSDQWKSIKQTFEKDTGKKKPGETVMGFIRKGSGLEKSLAAVDASIKDKKWDELVVAHKNLTKSITVWIEAAKSAMSKDAGYTKYADNVHAMIRQLRNLADEISDQVKHHAGNESVSLEELIGKTNFALICKPVVTDSAIKVFFSTQKLFTNAANGAQDRPLLQLQADGQARIKEYNGYLKDMTSLKGKVAARTELLKYTKATVGAMLTAIGKEGLLGVLTTYANYQAQALRAVNKRYADTTEAKLATKAAAPLNAGFDNLTKVELFLDNIRG